MEVALIAKACHQANKSICETYGDFTQKDWGEAEQWQRDSTVNSVKFAIENQAATPEHQHEAWMNEKLAEGWFYGDVKDSEAKTHPCLVDFYLLPRHQQAKDAVFSALVKALS